MRPCSSSSTSAATTSSPGKGGYPCDPRQGHIPGARNVEVSTLFAAPGAPKPADGVRALVGTEPEGRQVVTYCHSGSRSGLAVIVLRAAGYDAAATAARGTSGRATTSFRSNAR